jgi:hypothetical protein
MKIHIYVDPSKAVVAGKNFHGNAIVDINPEELTQEERTFLASCSWTSKNEKYGFDLTSHRVADNSKESAIAALRALMEEDRIEKEDKERKYETYVEECFNSVPEKWTSRNPYSIEGRTIQNYTLSCSADYVFWEFKLPIYIGNYDVRNRLLKDPRLQPWITEIKHEIELHNADARELVLAEFAREDVAKAEQEVLAKQRKQANAEKEQRRQDQIERWIAEKGTDNQRKRHDLKLLPENEVLDAMRDEAFAVLNDFPRYDKITKREVESACYLEYPNDVDFEVDDAESATADEFDLMERFQQLIPNAIVILRRHTGTCGHDNCDPVKRASLHVSITVGEIEFTREYACGD